MSHVLSFPSAPSPLAPLIRHPRTGFERLPRDLSRAELFRYFTFSDADLEQIRLCRGEINRLGFALLLGGIRLTGRFPYDLELLSPNLVAHVARQLQLNPPGALQYPQRRPTRHEHIARLKAYLGLRSFSADDSALVVGHIRERVRSGARVHTLLTTCEQFLRAQRVVLPGVKTLERVIGSARLTAEEELFAELSARVESRHAEKICGLLEQSDGSKQTPFQALQQVGKRATPKALGRELDALEQVRRLLPPTLDLGDLHRHALERLAGLVSGAHTRTLKRFATPKRLALLLCWLWRLRSQLTDTSLTIGNDLIAGVFRRARNAAEREQRRRQQQVREVAQACGEVIQALLDAAIPDDELRRHIFRRWTPAEMDLLATRCTELSGAGERYFTDELRRRYGYVRQFAPRLIEAFALQSARQTDAVLKAVTYLRRHDRSDGRAFSASAPLDFIPARWRPHVCPAPGVVDRALWEMCLLDRLRQGLRSGNLSVPHSRAFQAVEAHLIPADEWRQSRVEIARGEELPLEFAPHWQKVESLLKKQLRLLDEGYPEDPHLTISDDAFHVARLERLDEPPSARELKKRVRRLIARRQLGDLLLEVNSWTGFLRAFTRCTNGRPVTETDVAEQVKLLTALIGEGCNIGLSGMALAGPGISYHQLEEAHGHYVREETLAAAAAVLVNFHLGLPLTEAWGQGAAASSDAQLYGVPVRALNATFHPKYFASAGRGVAVYTHVSDTWMPFYTQVITCHARQAPFILDGLLYHATRLEPKEHYTDTHGYTELIFAVCHLLGIRFAPRIKDLPEQRLWCLPVAEPYQHIEGVFAGKVNRAVIGENWDEMIRLAASVKRGEVRASLVIGKLTAAGPRNRLYRGFQELGRLIKTAYLAEYLRDEELRRRVLLGLNKGESLHALARKMFYGGRGELRDRTYEDQLNAASALNLLLAAIVVWNTAHLDGCLERLRRDGLAFDEGDLRYLSPLMQRHINIFGRYSFDVGRYANAPAPDQLGY